MAGGNPIKNIRIEYRLLKSKIFSLCLGNSKALIEGVAKEICKQKEIEIDKNESFHKLVKKAFGAIGYDTNENITQVAGGLVTIAQNIGELRNTHCPIGHGKTISELENKSQHFDLMTESFLLTTVEIIVCFLIESFENFNSRVNKGTYVDELQYRDYEEFNAMWDNHFGEFNMGEYSYPASEILFNVDKDVYVYEMKNFRIDDEMEIDL